MNHKHQLWCLQTPVTAALVLVCLLSAGSALAQDVANGLALANVQAALVVTAVQDLDFGNVLQGVMKAQDQTDDALSGIFSITGQASAGLALYITLPDYMALADGSDRMTVAFGINDATIDTLVATPSTVVGADGWVDVDPHNLPAATVIGAAGQTNIYLGGRVIPAVNQHSGAYTGDITVTAAYNGT
jgi:hypothetical protein